jgi:hypothetical protein
MGSDGTSLVFTISSGGDREDTIEFFEREQFCLGHKEEDQNESDNVERCVCTESTLRSESSKHSRELKVSGKLGSSSSGRLTVRLKILENPKQTATDQAMPCSRWARGNTSAEYMKGTGPSPTE